jgi:hypothetical protein
MNRDLKELLKKWEIPDLPPQLDERVMATYSSRRQQPWIFRWTGSVRLPIPVFALLLLLQLVSGGVILRNQFFANPLPAPVLSMPERVVEGPVEKEKVLTRIVYLPASAAGNPDRRPAYAATNAESEKQPMDLTGFQPVSEFRMHVIKGGNRNER